jgi:hypothetical protein
LVKISESDPRSIDEATQRLAREFHAALFPEEYEHMFDSVTDAKGRQQGKNPMSIEYIYETNARRAQLGFTSFKVGPGASNDKTFPWVIEKLQQGAEAELRDLVSIRLNKDAEVVRRRARAHYRTQTLSWRDQRIDDMLASEAFIYQGCDRSEPRVIAVRILGELYNFNRSGSNEGEFYRQIRRILPDKSEAEFQELYWHAKSEWMEAYGY